MPGRAWERVSRTRWRSHCAAPPTRAPGQPGGFPGQCHASAARRCAHAPPACWRHGVRAQPKVCCHTQ
eukprot:1556333-Alexandrium_andersonii.AAC.1